MKEYANRPPFSYFLGRHFHVKASQFTPILAVSAFGATLIALACKNIWLLNVLDILHAYVSCFSSTQLASLQHANEMSNGTSANVRVEDHP